MPLFCTARHRSPLGFVQDRDEKGGAASCPHERPNSLDASRLRFAASGQEKEAGSLVPAQKLRQER